MTGAVVSLWAGVHVAMVTPFGVDGSVDHSEFLRHARWLGENGADALVAGGSLGEGSALTTEERVGLVRDLKVAVPATVPVIAAVAASTTAEAVRQARAARSEGAAGLLVLPPYVYRGDRRETSAHFSAVFRATELPCMLYNNPPAYGTDVAPEQVLELVTDHSNLTGVKESSGDVRRITALRALLGDRVAVSVGIDDALLEGVRSGATGWIAGLANALPRESAALFSACRAGEGERAFELYRWFLPLLRMDADPKFVQRIKLVTAQLGFGSARVRPPRLELTDTEREEVLAVLRDRLDHPPHDPAPGATTRAMK
jgi:1-pyrroline-4-hydroxy-2-carboxylate deaminase